MVHIAEIFPVHQAYGHPEVSNLILQIALQNLFAAPGQLVQIEVRDGPHRILCVFPGDLPHPDGSGNQNDQHQHRAGRGDSGNIAPFPAFHHVSPLYDVNLRFTSSAEHLFHIPDTICMRIGTHILLYQNPMGFP